MGACYALARQRGGRASGASDSWLQGSFEKGRRPPNKRMKLSIALASAPRDTEEGHSACPPFGGHRALAAYPRCSTDSLASAQLLATDLVMFGAAPHERPAYGGSGEWHGNDSGRSSGARGLWPGFLARTPARRCGCGSPSNKRMKLAIALASPHGTRRRGSACSPFGEHRALAAYPRCYADSLR